MNQQIYNIIHFRISRSVDTKQSVKELEFFTIFLYYLPYKIIFMVTLFVVLEYEYNKGERILGIFNSKEKAEDYIKQKSLYYYPDNKQTTLELRFDEWQLNKIRSRIN